MSGFAISVRHVAVSRAERQSWLNEDVIGPGLSLKRVMEMTRVAPVRQVLTFDRPREVPVEGPICLVLTPQVQSPPSLLPSIGRESDSVKLGERQDRLRKNEAPTIPTAESRLTIACSRPCTTNGLLEAVERISDLCCTVVVTGSVVCSCMFSPKKEIYLGLPVVGWRYLEGSGGRKDTFRGPSTGHRSDREKCGALFFTSKVRDLARHIDINGLGRGPCKT